jgi:hypothetical protein
MLMERMVLLQTGDIDPNTGRPYTGPPLRWRYVCTPNFKLDARGMHEYISVGRFRKPFEEVEADFVIDLDNLPVTDVTRVVELLGTFVERPLLYDSGSKGYHLVVPWQALGLPEGNWKPVYQAFVQAHGIPADLSVYRYRSLIRVPGSINARTGRTKKLIRPEDVGNPDAPEVRYEVKDATKLRDWLLAHRETTPATKTSAFNTEHDDVYIKLRRLGTPACVQRLYLDGIPAQGLRNTTYWTLAAYYRSSGKQQSEAEELLEEFARLHEANTHTPLRQRVAESQRIVRTVYRYRHKFSCRRVATELGVCSPACPLLKGSST